ncbi:hypothetical protein BpHYR1_005407 [Brachionus plicatilis]|uniref:Uncharacterized protein n=1 Tax=Brachionus plicatilis TaxID=10195 RepID=A0A3M7P6I1_BRAPC|nr:hypothetical protein BpHYR1_005407 [Brachionus plicatilis]
MHTIKKYLIKLIPDKIPDMHTEYKLQKPFLHNKFYFLYFLNFTLLSETSPKKRVELKLKSQKNILNFAFNLTKNDQYKIEKDNFFVKKKGWIWALPSESLTPGYVIDYIACPLVVQYFGLKSID